MMNRMLRNFFNVEETKKKGAKSVFVKITIMLNGPVSIYIVADILRDYFA